MQTKISYIVILNFVLSIGFGQEINSVSELSYAKSVVGSETDDHFKSYSEHFNFYFYKNEYTEYDIFGNIIFERNIDEDGSVISNKHILYLDSIRISSIDYLYPKHSISNYSITYNYNSQFQLIQEITTDSEEIVVDSIFYPKNNTIETLTYRDQELLQRTVNYLDSLNYLGKIYFYDYQDSLLYIRCNQFDNEMRLIKSSHCDIFENPLVTTSFEYDNTGYIRYEKRESHSINEIEESFFAYDSIENVSTRRHSNNGELNYWSKTYYDRFKNEVRTEFYDNLGEIEFSQSYKFVYDENNKWIKKLEYENEELLSVTYRSILYF